MSADAGPVVPVTSGLASRRPPRCPEFVAVRSAEDLAPYLRNVAGRPYSQGLHPAWDLQRGERVLIQADNWYDPLCLAAIKNVMDEFGCKYEIQVKDRGPIPTFSGADEVDFFTDFTRELAELMDEWQEFESSGSYDKILWGFGGPILGDAKIRVQRLPFITPEMVATPAHMLPIDLLTALDHWTWERVSHARRIHISDPEGTDLTFTNHDEYYDSAREFFNPGLIDRWFPQNTQYAKRPLGGHIWGKPWVFLGTDQEDGRGAIAGTMNHIGPHPAIRMTVDGSLVQEISGGGEYGDKLRAVQQRTADMQFPGHPGKGLLHWWEASIGTNPKIHRPREGFMQGWCCGLYERMRSGVIHIGFGTIISSEPEREAIRQGLPAGHFHVHLYFPTVIAEMDDGRTEVVIDEGHLKALDDEAIHDLAARHGDPAELLTEQWIPAIPGLNMPGDYALDYASDPMDWTQTELHVCRRWHHLYMKMIQADSASHAGQ